MEPERKQGILGRLFGSRPRREAMTTPQAVDPVCGMSVDTDRARSRGLTMRRGDEEIFFCSEGCKRAYEASPERFGARV